MSGDKPKLPANLRPLADKALAKHHRRISQPHVSIEGDELGAWFECPYADEDSELWQALLFQSFGTRSFPVVRCFLLQLSKLCARQWDEGAARWRPSQDEFDAMLAVIGAMRVKDEAQAAYAAQLVALHLASMRLAKRVTGEGYVDERTVAVMAKTVRAYGDGLMQMQRLQGRGRATRQSIKAETVRHQHLHYHGGGDRAFRGQAHESGTRVIAGSPALPGEEQVGVTLSIEGGEGPPRLPEPRRRSRDGCASG